MKWIEIPSIGWFVGIASRRHQYSMVHYQSDRTRFFEPHFKDCESARYDLSARRNVSKWRKKKRKRKRNMNQCQTICKDQNFAFDGMAADCVCIDGKCDWTVPEGTCVPRKCYQKTFRLNVGSALYNIQLYPYNCHSLCTTVSQQKCQLSGNSRLPLWTIGYGVGTAL